MLLNGIIMTSYFASKGVPVGIPESENADYRRFECLYYQGRVKLTEGTDYTYVVEGNDAPPARVAWCSPAWAITVAPSRRRSR